ncbi:MAG TPA: alpha/beta hydrolase family protein [Candidatus Angelobacter sp.]
MSSSLRKTAACGVAIFSLLMLMAGCKKEQAAQPDHPRLTQPTKFQDVTFRSAALNRDMPYRIVLPTVIPPGHKLPTVYLLHGGGGSFHDWSNYSDVAQFAERGLLLVMPEGGSSYYVNSATESQDRYEDYIVNDLIADVQSRFPAADGRSNRAIVGVSMGGFGAVKLALSHPDLFSFAAGISPAIDVPSRPYSEKRASQWNRHSAIFGPWGSQTRRDKDPFVLARSANAENTPYIYLSCGDQEGLLPSNKQFAALLDKRHFHYEFHSMNGGHDWNQWNAHMLEVFQSLQEHITLNSGKAPLYWAYLLV